jgi:hypothetical protein
MKCFFEIRYTFNENILLLVKLFLLLVKICIYGHGKNYRENCAAPQS